MVGIYKITSPSGRVYIGQSWNIRQRRNYYSRVKCKNQIVLYNSILKYGWESHSFDVIHELPEDVEQVIMDAYECLYMDQYKECGVTLINMKGGGLGGKLSQEIKTKIGNKHKGRVLSEEHKKKCSISLSGRKITDETRNKMSAAQKGRKSWNKGRGNNIIYTPELRNKIGLAKIGKPISQFQKEALLKSIVIPVVQLTIDGVFLKEWASAKEAERQTGVLSQNISQVCKGKYKSSGGYKWKYKSDFIY